MTFFHMQNVADIKKLKQAGICTIRVIFLLKTNKCNASKISKKVIIFFRFSFLQRTICKDSNFCYRAILLLIKYRKLTISIVIIGHSTSS